jgi:uncharacterized protein with von Willebrand factor type A (vWA) domain
MSPQTSSASGMTGIAPPLLTPLLRLVHALREAGVPVSTSEVVDAMAALHLIEIVDRA